MRKEQQERAQDDLEKMKEILRVQVNFYHNFKNYKWKPTKQSGIIAIY